MPGFDPISMAIGGGLSLVNSIGKFISGAKQSKEAKKINPVWQQYQANPYAAKQLALAQQLFGGRMAGAPQLERNIFSSQGNTLANVNRNATDASQALAMGAATQGQTDASLNNLQIQEAQNKYAMLNNLNAAYGQQINEGDKVYNSQMQKYMSDVQRKDALANAGAQNKYGAVNDASSMAMQFGMLGGFGNGAGNITPGVNNNMVSQNPIQRTQLGNVNNMGTMGTIPYNPAQSWQIPGLANYINRPR